MAEETYIPLDPRNPLGVYKASRSSWRLAGVDNFSKPPGQNPDMCEQLINVLPPLSNSLQRRFGYTLFSPSLDQGIALGGDQISQAALYGANFDGSTAYVSTAVNAGAWNAVSYSYSAELWFATTSTPGANVALLSLNADNITNPISPVLMMLLAPTGKLIGATYTGSSFLSSPSTAVAYNDGQPHHIVLTALSSSGTVTLKLYVDGVLQSTSSAASSAASNSTSYWRLGQGDIGYYNGFLSHVSVWSQILTGAQVTAHYNALVGANGNQSHYESVVEADGPLYFWFLTESAAVAIPPKTMLVQFAQNAQTASSVQAVFSQAVTAGNLILVTASQEQFSHDLVVSDNMTNSYTQIGSETGGLYVWFAYAKTSGPLTVTLSQASSNRISVIAHELFGVVSSSPLDQQSMVYNAATGFNSPSITTTTFPQVIWSVVNGGYFPTINPNQDFTTVASVTLNDPVVSNRPFTISSTYSQALTATGTYSPSWTNTTYTNMARATFSLKLNAVITPTAGSAYDSVGTNTGTYNGTIARGQYVIA